MNCGGKNMKNITYKNIIIIFLLFVVFIILNIGNSKAVLQANGATNKVDNVSNWMMNVRKMESLGGAMGLSENVTNDLIQNGNSNNIDVHMQKNTEYGALVILSASSYGKPDKVNAGETTTGNATGVLMRLNSEWVAAGTIKDATNYVNARSRYKNIQTTDYAVQKGDAVTETTGWHGSDKSQWISLGNIYTTPKSDPLKINGLLRAVSGSIFSYDGLVVYGSNGGPGGNWYGSAHWSYSYATRAVIVSGEGF